MLVVIPSSVIVMASPAEPFIFKRDSSLHLLSDLLLSVGLEPTGVFYPTATALWDRILYT